MARETFSGVELEASSVVRGGGETGALIRAFDWSATSLGPMVEWQQSLRTAVDIVTASPAAMVLMWGQDHTMIYNDAYARIAASKHPAALGGKVSEIWPEIWDWNRRILEAGFRGESLSYPNHLMVLERNGTPEDVLFDLFYSPVRDETGGVAGVLCTVMEITLRVHAERRLGFLLELSERLRNLSDPIEMMGVAAGQLGRYLHVPRVGYGEIDDDETTITVHHDWTDGSVASLAGETRPLDGFGSAIVGELRAGRTAMIDDVTTDADTRNLDQAAFAGSDARALLIVPLIRQGRLNAVLYLHDQKPRTWNIDNASLAEDVAARTWSAVQRARAEMALRESNQRLHIAQRAGKVGAFSWDPQRGEVDISDEFRELWGLGAGRTMVPLSELATLIQTDDRHLVQSLNERVDNDALAYTEYRIKRPDNGEMHWMARRGEMVELPNGEIRGIGVVYDITDRKRLEGELRKLNEDLEAQIQLRTVERDRIWNVSQDLFAVADKDGLLLTINPAWTRVLGWEAEELLGNTTIWLEHPEDHERTQSELQSLASGRRTLRFENRLRHRDGTYRWLSWTAVPEEDRIYAVARDVTAEKAQAEALVLAEEALRQSQKMEAIGQLTGGIAHDFNNLLTGIIGALDLMQRRAAAGRLDDLPRYIDVATTAANRAAALTHRLLAFARRQSLDVKPVDINGLIASLEDLVRRTMGESIVIEFDLKSGLWQALTDSNQLESALLNLVINARDAMPDGGRLQISTDNVHLGETFSRVHDLDPGDYVAITVTDSGTGMTSDVAAKAFEPFFTTKPLGQGTGLGLSMIYGFAHQTGGHIALYSAPGKGTQARLYLPQHSGAALGIESHSALPRTPRAHGGEMVLVVEDDAAVRMLVVEVLQDLGYRALEAIDSTTALPILYSEASIDVMITDIGLPGLNGHQIADLARKKRPGLKVLFITGYAESETLRSEPLDPGMALLTKPFSSEILAERVSGLLQGH